MFIGSEFEGKIRSEILASLTDIREVEKLNTVAITRFLDAG